MLKYIPPAGHILYWKDIISSCFSDNDISFYFENLFSENEIYFLNSGTSALYFLLKSFQNKNSEKNEVVIPGYTCPTVAAAIIKAGLKPVLCDLRINNFSLDIDTLKNLINNKTLAVIQVELFGISANNDKILEELKDREIYFIGDAAQSFGNYLNDKNLLSKQGYDFLVFSLGRGKPINLLHGGGIIAKNNISLDISLVPQNNQFLKIFLNVLFFKFFFNPVLYQIPKSLPFLKLGETIFSLDFQLQRINSFISKLGYAVAKRSEEIYKLRQEQKAKYLKIIEKYKKYFLEIDYSENELIRFPVLFRSNKLRNRIMAALQKNGIGATNLYPNPLNTQPGLEEYKLIEHINSTRIADQILTLPINDYVTDNDYLKVDKVFSEHLT